MSMLPAWVVLTPAGLTLARRLAARFPGSQVHGSSVGAPGSDRPFDQFGAHLRTLFQERKDKG